MTDRMLICMTILATGATALADKSGYSAAERVLMKAAEREMKRAIDHLNSEDAGYTHGMNEPVRLKRPGHPDSWVPIPPEELAHLTATVDWDSFRGHVDATHDYAFVGEHCNQILWGIARCSEYCSSEEDGRAIVHAEMRGEIKSVHCRFDPGAFVDQKTQIHGDVLRLAGGILTAGYNWDTATLDVESRTSDWLKKQL